MFVAKEMSFPFGFWVFGSLGSCPTIFGGGFGPKHRNHSSDPQKKIARLDELPQGLVALLPP